MTFRKQSVTWRPYFLRSGMPAEGVAKAHSPFEVASFTQQLIFFPFQAPNTPDNPRVNPRMKAIGDSVGINFTGKCDIAPNSMLSHCLLSLALELDPSSQLQDRVNEVYPLMDPNT